jgi:hypothetical protein
VNAAIGSDFSTNMFFTSTADMPSTSRPGLVIAEGTCGWARRPYPVLACPVAAR